MPAYSADHPTRQKMDAPRSQLRRFPLIFRATYQEILMNHTPNQYMSCIEACQECATACHQCFAACLKEDDVKMMARCIALDTDCAAACSFAADAMACALLSPLALQAQPAPLSGMKGAGMDQSLPQGKMDMKAMMKENNDRMASVPMSGNPDVDFAQMMRIHHQGAIDMAQTLLRDGKDPQMLKMAKNIISAQKKEIAELEAFLARSGKTPAASAK